MSVSFIYEKDLTALKDMRKYCFSIDDDSAARSLENRYTPENYLGYFEEGYLAASAEICPFNIYFHRSLVGMGGIAWVALSQQGVCTGATAAQPTINERTATIFFLPWSFFL